MIWRTIRLELDRSAAFPLGSAGRAYLLCLPLKDEWSIDGEALRRMPVRATVSRFWPNQADMSGHVVPVGGGWAFSYEGDGGRIVPQPPGQLFGPGGPVLLTEPDGSRLCFRVKLT